MFAERSLLSPRTLYMRLSRAATFARGKVRRQHLSQFPFSLCCDFRTVLPCDVEASLGPSAEKKKEKTSCALHLDNFQVFRLITKPRILNNYCCKSIRVEYVLTSPVLQGEFPHILLDFLPCVKMYLTIVSTRKK
jgi:hypothetical protein